MHRIFGHSVSYITFFVLWLWGAASAYTQETGVRGRVTLGVENAVMPGVNVVAVGGTQGAVTGADGRFTITDLPAGRHEIEARCVGYRSARVAVVVPATGMAEAVLHLEESAFQLDDVVVTGTIAEHRLKNTPVVTEVIPLREIQTAGSRSLSDIMAQQTGIEISNGIGRTQSAQLHGLSDNHVLVLVDGERIAGKVDGAVDLGQIPVESIERIEVVKGPLSAKYGSDALGGVINVITRRGGQGPTASLAATAGSSGRQDYEASFGEQYPLAGAGDLLHVFGRAGWHAYDGVDYDPADNFMELPAFTRGSAALKGGTRVGRLTADLSASYDADESEWLAGDEAVYFRDVATNKKWTGTAGAGWDFNPTTSLRVSAHSSDNRHTFEESGRDGTRVSGDEARETISVLRAQLAAMPYDASNLTLGYEYSGEQVESQRVPGGGKAYYNNVLYGEDEWTMGRATLSVGARWSHNSVYGSFLAPRASLVFSPGEHFTLRGSYGRGFRAPSIKELYIDFANTGVGYMVEGNPALHAETSQGVNLGLSYNRGDLVWFRVNGYYNALDNLIDYYLKSTNPNVLSYRNIEDAITTGVDVDVDVQPVSALVLSAGYAFTLAENGDGQKLPFRTPNMVNMKAVWTWAALALRTTLRARWNDRQLVTDEETNLAVHEEGVPSIHFYTPAYWVFDAMADMPVFTRFRVSAGVNNILDYTYYPFGQIKPREFFAGLSFAWQ